MSGRPARVNKQLAKTCKKCEAQILAVYEGLDHAQECEINCFLLSVSKMKRLDIDNELAQTLKTAHGLPITEYKLPIKNGNGFIHAVYAPEWLSEGINIYHSTSFAGLSLGEFLTSLNPG